MEYGDVEIFFKKDKKRVFIPLAAFSFQGTDLPNPSSFPFSANKNAFCLNTIVATVEW